ncbi:MAG TPA: hypothetical protein EYP14_16860 [Planctomycetaceae bacterium]|nr:hypothetical protein [Planctomycetaceae bacterium]
MTRLMDMGIEGYLLGASLNMVLAQRLCRRICPKCKTAVDPPKALLLDMERLGLELETYYHGRGCKRCRHTGFSGRIAIHELLVLDDELREIITTTPTRHAVEDYARRTGMATLRYDGLCKVKEGITTFEEVLRVTDEGWRPIKPARRARLSQGLRGEEG